MVLHRRPLVVEHRRARHAQASPPRQSRRWSRGRARCRSARRRGRARRRAPSARAPPSATRARPPWPPGARRGGGRSRCGRCRSARTARSSARSRARSRALRGPRRAGSSITGRMTSTCGLFVRSTQMRIARRPRQIARQAGCRPLYRCAVRCSSSPRSRKRSSTKPPHFVRDGGLPAIFALMAISSACIPIPSEVVMLFAGFAVADPGRSAAHHHLTLLGVVARGPARDDGRLVGRLRRSAAAGASSCSNATARSCTWAPPRSSAPIAGSQRYGEAAVLFGRLVPLSCARSCRCPPASRACRSGASPCSR